MNIYRSLKKTLLTCAFLILASEEILAQTVSIPLTEIPRLNQLPKTSSNVQDLLVQEPTQEPLKVTGIKINPSPTGIEVILETSTGQLLPSSNSTDQNSFIADIENAILDLPNGGEFESSNPLEGISLVKLTQIETNKVRLIITGSTALPITEILPSDGGLALNVTPVTDLPTAEEIEVVVSATRTEQAITDIPRSVTVIEREEIEKQAAVSRDLQDILTKTVPGLGPPRQQQYGPTLRGRNPLILVDGIPMSSNFTTGFVRDWRTIEPGAIERIEVVRGPSAIYGEGAAGGVINIITRKPQEEFTATTEVGTNFSLTHPSDSFGYNLQQFISGTADLLDFTGNFGVVTTGDYFDAEGDRIPLFDYGASNSQTVNFLTKLGANFDENQRLQITFNYFQDYQNYSYISDLSIIETPGQQKPRALKVGELDFVGTSGPGNVASIVSLNYNHQDLLGSELAFQAYYRSTNSRGAFYDLRPYDPTDPYPIGRSVQESERFGGRLQINTPIVESVKLLWGADYSNEDISETYDDFDTEKFDASGFRVLEKIGDRTVSPVFTLESLGFFAQLQWDISEQFILSGGVRYDQFDVRVPSYVNQNDNFIGGGERNPDGTVFNGGLVYKITPEFSLYANYAQGFSLPDIARLLRRPPEGFDFGRDVELSEPIKVDNYEIGLRGEWENVQLSLAGFYTESELGASVVFDDPSEPGKLVRAPRRDYGVEAAIDWQPGAGFSLGTTITYIESEDDLDGDGEYLAISSFDVSPIKWTLYVEHQTTPSWTNRLQLLYSGDRDSGFEAGNDGAPIYSYAVVDYISTLELGPGTLLIAIENLFNNQYSTVTSQFIGGFDESAYFPARGTTFSINYRLKW